MTTEEKANAYDKAIENSKEFYALCKKCGAKDTADFLENIFPELKEGEDENDRIRENAIHIIRRSMNGIVVPLPISIFKECITWLENQ